ncbi:2546_t:CDS:1, partial [Funneliformis caledonium]
ILKEFMEGKRVKYFAYEFSRISSVLNLENQKFQNLVKLAGEVQPFVKMVKYNDLIVTISDFD